MGEFLFYFELRIYIKNVCQIININISRKFKVNSEDKHEEMKNFSNRKQKLTSKQTYTQAHNSTNNSTLVVTDIL